MRQAGASIPSLWRRYRGPSGTRYARSMWPLRTSGSGGMAPVADAACSHQSRLAEARSDGRRGSVVAVFGWPWMVAAAHYGVNSANRPPGAQVPNSARPTKTMPARPLVTTTPTSRGHHARAMIAAIDVAGPASTSARAVC